jgi:hypothetical protein
LTYYSIGYVRKLVGVAVAQEVSNKNQSIKSMIYMFREQMVDLSGKKSNQIFDELANWEEALKGSSLTNPAPPAP